MTPQKIVEAYIAVQELSSIVLPFKTARKLAALRKNLKEAVEVVEEARCKIIEEFGGVEEQRGLYQFDDKDNSAKCSKALEDYMGDTDDTFTLPEVDLSDYTDQIKLSAGALEALEDIIIFDKE